MMQRGVQAAERAFASLRPVGNARKLPPLTPDDHHIIALRGKRPRDMIDQRDAAEQGRALVRTEAPRRATRGETLAPARFMKSVSRAHVVMPSTS